MKRQVRRYRRRNPGPVAANVTVDWRTIGMAGAVIIVLVLFAKKQAKDAAAATGAALDITSKTNIASKAAEALNNPGGMRKDPMTGKPATLGSDQWYADHPDMDPTSAYYRYRKDAKGNLVNYDKNGNYIYAAKFGKYPPEKTPTFWNFVTGMGTLPPPHLNHRYTA